MVKAGSRPIWPAYSRKSRAPIPWKVPAQSASVMTPALSPITLRAIRSMRRAISAAARREKVISRILRGSAPLTIKWATRCARVLVLPDPRPGNDEEWGARRRIVLPHAMLDSPPLFRIEFFEIGDRHWLRISMEAGDSWNHLSRLDRNTSAVAIGLELLAASPDLSLAGQFTSVAAKVVAGEGAKTLEVQLFCPSPCIDSD